jgi:signal recognition particle subunit SRP54
MFETLTERLQAAFRKLRSQGTLSEADVRAGLRDVRLALLEADVNLQVTKDFIARVQERAVGEEVLRSLSPAQQVVKIVHEELVRLLTECKGELTFSPVPPTIIMLLGLQGGGKTTTAGKLALWAKKRGHSPLLVATDTRRPAAIEQLRVIAEQVGCPSFSLGDRVAPAEIARAALAHAQRSGFDCVIADTQGRLQTDEALMAELQEVARALNPHESLLVLDAMTGQEAVRVATAFAAGVPLTGLVLSKLDGDARGGAALSVGFVTGKPIKFVGTGEGAEALDVFQPDRIAGRVLGMGDVLGLIERAQETIDQEQALKVQQRLLKGEINLEDFLGQLRQMRKLGPLEQVLSMIPGLNRLPAAMRDEIDESQVTRMEAIILSMTPEERATPEIVGGSRKRRIAGGSGVSVADVNGLLKEFKRMRKMFKQMGSKGKLGRDDFARLLLG